jgi:hypothetical protein
MTDPHLLVAQHPVLRSCLQNTGLGSGLPIVCTLNSSYSHLIALLPYPIRLLTEATALFRVQFGSNKL